MAKATKQELYVVDGSNIATEGRSTPSLDQLNEAVLAFIDDHPSAAVTVVVDATFGHRIAKKEVAAFDEAVANNELVTPPAGAVGRGDAFVLSIADKAGAGILSNDSFQEFHGEYDWLFDHGRLIGGKPVPHVGWVFVERTPVRGPKSRQAVREAKADATGDAKETKQRANRRVKKKAASGSAKVGAAQRQTIEQAKAASPPKEHVNELMPFLEFVEQHPVGTSCTGVVESYASHGAYARVGDVLIYIPLRLMDDPTPRSARSVVTVGEAVAVVIVGFVPDRRSIDAALPHMADATSDSADAPSPEPVPAEQTSARRAPAKKKAPAKKAPAKKSPAKKKAPAKKTAPAKKAPAKQKAPAKKAPARKKAPAKKAPAKQKAPAKKAPAKKKAPTRKSAATVEAAS